VCSNKIQVHNKFPDLTREGGSIPVALTFEVATGYAHTHTHTHTHTQQYTRIFTHTHAHAHTHTHTQQYTHIFTHIYTHTHKHHTHTHTQHNRKNVLLLPVGACDDGAHSQNEKFDRINYINGIKLLCAYFEQTKALATKTKKK